MSEGASILRTFEVALGKRPAELIDRGRSLREPDLELVVGAWRAQAPETDVRTRGAQEIWPLISHHPFNGHTLFGGDAGRTMLPRILSILLAHDGIVAANPLSDVARLLAHDRVDEAVQLTADVVAGLATCEPLIDRGVLRFTDRRPALADDMRRSILGAFNIDPEMSVFTNFLEAAVALPDLPAVNAREYVRQANELFVVLGLPAPELLDTDRAVAAIRSLASAVIEVSWQMAVCAADDTCDLALVTPLERQVAEVVLSEAAIPNVRGQDFSQGQTRHLSRLSAGDIPNLATAGLSVTDALAIRESDAFEEFRIVLRRALDALDDGLRVGQDPATARATFEERMVEGSIELGTRARTTSFRNRMRDTSVPVLLGAASAAFLAPLGPEFAALGGSIASVTGTVWQWLTGRRPPSGTQIGRRYISMLSGSPRLAADPRSLGAR